MAPNSSNNSYLLEIDGNTCYTVGDSAITANTWTWVDYRDGNSSSKINVALTADNHTIKMIGREADVKLDRVIFATDTSVDDFTGLPCNSAFEPTVQITDQNLIEGANMLRVESILDNNNGNFGTVQVVRVQYDGSNWNVVETYLSDTYSFPDGVGEGDDFTFDYP